MTTPNTILGVLEPKAGLRKGISTLVTVLAGSAILALASRVNIPLIPVPANFATLAVAALAAAFGWRIGVAMVLAYIVEGLLGLPVFSFGGGVGYLLSPTFGFIVGYLPLAYIVGRAADAGLSRNMLALFGVMLAADAVLFAFGYTWLLAMARGASWIDPNNMLGSAFTAAVQPFIIWDVLKMAFAAVTVTGAWVLLRKKA
ncbi:MAG TPA: biotin transporter BioY [Devosiaceae bacterium]